MRRNTLLVDAGIALVLMILLVIIAPGLAVVGFVALLILAVLGLSYWRERRRASRMRRSSRARVSGRRS